LDHFDLVQSVVECAERGEPIENVAATFQRAIERLGFYHFACCSHTDPLNPAPGAVLLHNYPAPWVKAFMEGHLHRIDPVLRYADRSPSPFPWNAPEFLVGLKTEQKKILAAAGTYGLIRGYTVPIRLSWLSGTLHASCSLVADTGSLDPHSYEVAERLAIYLYAAAMRLQMPVGGNAAAPVELAQRERQCLEFAARGCKNWEISRILKISESTVRTYIARAMKRIGAMTRAHAVAYALMTRQISFGDVVRAPARLDRRPAHQVAGW
jgi:DNA-binding CsgD family transcriptional regulator